MYCEYKGEREKCFSLIRQNQKKCKKERKQTVQSQGYFFLILCVEFSLIENKLAELKFPFICCTEIAVLFLCSYSLQDLVKVIRIKVPEKVYK